MTRRSRRGPFGARATAQGVRVQLKEHPLLRPQLRVAEALPGPPGVLQGGARPQAQQGDPLLFLNRLGDRDQQPLAGSEVVEEHPVAGADRRGELAQAQVSDPGVEGMADGGGEQALPGDRGCGYRGDRTGRG